MGGLISRTKTSNTQLPPKEEVAEDVPVLKHSLDFAWVTLATNDSYSLGALVLAHSLRIANTAHKLVVLVTPVVSSSMREQLSNVFDFVKVVDVLDSEDEAHLALLKRPELGVTFTKIHCWRLIEFQKCVFLDADTLVLKNCDELFEREELSAAPDVGWPDCFNTGVFVYKPSIETFNDLIRFSIEQGSFDGGDQGLLNQFFSDWATKDISKHLPFLYNLTSVAVYSYIPAFKHYESQIRIVHFIGSGKPWLQYMDPSTKTVMPTPGSEHLTSLLQMWWDIFCEKVHPSLTKNLECARGMSNQQTEACVNSITIETNNETVSSTLKKPFTPYIDKDDSRQINLPYHPFDVKSSSGELLNITFLAEREQEMLQENGCATQFSDISFSAGKSCSKEQENISKSEPLVYKNSSSYEKLIEQPNEIEEKQCTLDKNNLCHEEERFLSAITKEINLEEKRVENYEDIQSDKKEEEVPEKERPEKDRPEEENPEEKKPEEKPEEEKPEEEKPEEEQSPFHYNAFFPDETCIDNYLKQNVSIYKPLGSVNKNYDLSDVKTICGSKIDNHQQQSLPRFLTIAENDKRQSLNVHNGNFCSHDKQSKCTKISSAVENMSSFKEEKIRKTLSQENLNFFSHNVNLAGELQKSKSMSNLEANSASVEEVSFWKSHPNLNSDPNKKYSMPKLKPLLPKQQNKSSIKPNQIIPKITQYTEFHMSSDYKDVFDESYDKLGFVEKQILEQARLRNRKLFTFPYLHPQRTPKKTNENHSKLVQQNSIHDLADLSSCQRQRGNQPLSDITQSSNSRTENACFLPVLKPLKPRKDENEFKNLKPKTKLAKEKGTKAKMESRKAREKAKSQFETKTKIINSHNVEEVLERLINFSKNYQNYFSDFISENKNTNERKLLTIRSGIFKKTNSLENNHSDNNYCVPLYESPRLQYDKEFESGDAYFEDIRSRGISEKRIINGEASEKDQCKLKKNQEFYHFEDYLTKRDKNSKKDPSIDNCTKIAVERLPFQVRFMQPFKGSNTEMSAENKVKNLWKNILREKAVSEDINIKEKNVIEKETSMERSKNCNDGVEEGVQYKTRNKMIHNELTNYGTEYAEGNDAYNRNFKVVNNPKNGVPTNFVLHEINEKLTKGNVREKKDSDPISQYETKVENKLHTHHISPKMYINELDRTIPITGNERKFKNGDLKEDYCFKEGAQSSCQAEPTIESFSKQGHETFKAIGETVQVVCETSKLEKRIGSLESEKGKNQTTERRVKRNRSETDNRKWGKTERQKRRKSSKVFAFPLENSSGDTLASVEHEKFRLSKSVDAPSRLPKFTAHHSNKIAQDSRKVDDLGSPEDFSHNNSGIAGAIAKLSLQPGGLTGAESEAASTAQEDYIRRQNWEMGTMDYMGRDSFNKIWSKICETLDGKVLKDANLDVATNNQDRTASKPATSKDELGSVGIGVAEGIKESEMNEFSRKAIVNEESEESDLQSVEKFMNYAVPIVEISTNINKEQPQCNGKVENIAKENALNVYNLAGENPINQGKRETFDMSSAFTKSVETPEPFGKLFVSGPIVLVPSVKTNAEDNEDTRNKFYIQESENKMRDSEVKGADSVGSSLPDYATHKIAATVETVKYETEKRQDSSSSEASIGTTEMPNEMEIKENYNASEVSIQTPKQIEKKQDCVISEILTDTIQAQKNNSGKGQNFLAAEELTDISPTLNRLDQSTLKDDEVRKYDSGSFEAVSTDVLIFEENAQQLQDFGASEPSSDTIQIPKTDTEITNKTPCEDLEETESVEVNKKRKGVLNKLLELVGVGTPTKDTKTKNEISKSVFYDIEGTYDEEYANNASKNSSEKDNLCKSVFYDTEISTQIQTNEDESVPKTLESNAELSEEQMNEKCMSSISLNINELSDSKPGSDSENNNEDYFGNVRTNYAATKGTADVCENNESDKEKGNDSASAYPNVKVTTEPHAVQSKYGTKFSSDAEVSESGATTKFQPPEKDSEIHDADVPGKHLEIGKDSTLKERKDSIKSEEKGSCDLESIKIKINDIIDEAKKVVEQLQEGTYEMKEDEYEKDNVLKTGNEQFPTTTGSSEISVKIFQSDVASAQTLPRNVEVHSASNDDQEETTKEQQQPREKELLSREKEALETFGKVFVSGPIFIKPDVSAFEHSEQVTEPISESDTKQAVSNGVEKDKSKEEVKDETKISSSDSANLDQAHEWRPKDSKSETDAVHRIFQEIDGGKETCGKESSSVQASSVDDKEMQSEEEPIYCNIDDIEEIRVTSEEDRKSWKPRSSKLTEQILKAIPPPRRKPFSDAKAEGSATLPEMSQMLASIPSQSVSILLDRPITEEMVVAEVKAEETSSAAAPPVPPRRTRSKGRQPPLPPPKKKKK